VKSYHSTIVEKAAIARDPRETVIGAVLMLGDSSNFTARILTEI
jgi:hypothetical protein